MEFLIDLFLYFVDLLLNLDQHLTMLLDRYGPWLYGILFLIIFCETGLVVTPFLPGDSLLFMAGALAASGGLDPVILIPLLFAAAVIGDSVNYMIGQKIGNHVIRLRHSRFFNYHAYEATQAFYARHGGKAIIIARFMPLVRTFVPFVAGVASMSYRRFLLFNILGAALWVGPLIMLGYWFGNLPIIRNNLTLFVLGIIGISLLPIVIGWLRHRLSRARTGN